MSVTAISDVKYMWRLNESPRGRRSELNSLELRAQQQWDSESSPTHHGQLNHVPLPLFYWMPPWARVPAPTCDTQLQLWVPAVEWGTPEGAAELGPLCAGAAPAWVSRVRWHCAEGGSCTRVPSSTRMAPVTAEWAASHHTHAVAKAMVPADFWNPC